MVSIETPATLSHGFTGDCRDRRGRVIATPDAAHDPYLQPA